MRTNFSAWITHAYLFCISFIFGGLAIISGYKSIPISNRYKKFPEFMDKRFHLTLSLLFISLSLISFIYWVFVTVIIRGGIFYSIHGISGLITISTLVIVALTGFLKKKRVDHLHQRISMVAWYLFSISLLIGWVISIMGNLRAIQIIFP